MYDFLFLLAIHSIYDSMLYHFRDITRLGYSSKSYIFHTHFYSSELFSDVQYGAQEIDRPIRR